MFCHLTGTDRHPKCLHRGILASARGKERRKKRKQQHSKSIISAVLFCSFRLISASLDHLTLFLREHIFLHYPVVEAPKKFNHPTQEWGLHTCPLVRKDNTGSGDWAGLTKIMYMGSVLFQEQETSCPSWQWRTRLHVYVCTQAILK